MAEKDSAEVIGKEPAHRRQGVTSHRGILNGNGYHDRRPGTVKKRS